MNQIETAERSIQTERRRWGELVTLDDGTPAAWEELVRRTAKVTTYNVFWPQWDAASGYTPSSSRREYGLDPQLAAEWDAYAERWEQFLDKNPRARIASLMIDVSENSTASSWPNGYEAKILKWISGGYIELPVWRLRPGFPDDAWKAKMASAMDAAGPGWVFYEGRPDSMPAYVWMVGDLASSDPRGIKSPQGPAPADPLNTFFNVVSVNRLSTGIS